MYECVLNTFKMVIIHISISRIVYFPPVLHPITSISIINTGVVQNYIDKLKIYSRQEREFLFLVTILDYSIIRDLVYNVY